MSAPLIASGLLLAVGLLAQSPAPTSRAASSTQPASRPRLSSSAQRNENIQVHRIDNDAIKEANVRLGVNVTFLSEFSAQSSYFAADHGRPPQTLPLLTPRRTTPDWHAELYHWHQNSIFNARTFFQVGPLKPARRNGYGLRAGGGAGWLGQLSFNGNQRKIRGMVNGNVLVPLAEERTPLAADPAVRALVNRWLAAYPPELPNRPDFDPRALNTNAPQRIDETDGDVRLERSVSASSRLVLSHALSRQRESAFQLVAGQNPDTDIHTHRTRLTWAWTPSSSTVVSLGLAFDRVRSWLRPEPRAVGPRIRIGFQIEELGPDSMFPIDRADNRFGWAGLLRRELAAGKHELTLGGDWTRVQLNGVESNNQRGYFQFTNNFGRTAVENLRWGTPSSYEVTLGELARGFRNWKGNIFWGDQWRATGRLQVYFGLRYNALTVPVEIHELDRLPYSCDCNNFSPRLGVAWNLTSSWTLRSGYVASFGEILPVTYQQIRNNLPQVRYIQVQNPDVLNPLRGIDLRSPQVRTSPTWFSPDLVSPYAHQYNFGIERRLPRAARLRLGYIGSRSVKLLNSFILNRAEPVPGIPLTTATVDQRRPDPRYYEIKYVVNAGLAYLDAVQLSLDLPFERGLGAGLRYTFSKAIDEGADYSSTAANADILRGRSQWQYEQLRDRRGLSNFDSPHALEVHAVWDVPTPPLSGWLRRFFQHWQVSAAALFKSGTPFTLYVGSDAPGFGNVDGGPSDRPHILDPSILGRTVDDPNTSSAILRRDRFAFIRPGEHRGSLGRNTFRKDGIANLNASVGKQWRWNGWREWNLSFRAEAYNLTNHPQFDEPQRNLSSPSFGRITNTLNYGRILQLGLRLSL